MPDPKTLSNRLSLRLAEWQNQRRIAGLAWQVAAQAQPQPGQPPVVFFNASTRLAGLSLNAAFSLLASWGLRLAGAPVVHFVSRSGLSRCVLGTNREDYHLPPPCEACIAQSERLYAKADVRWFTYAPHPGLVAALKDLSIEALGDFEYEFSASSQLSGIPLGRLVLPSMRWALRRHHLPDDEPTRYLFREYILSAYNAAKEFCDLMGRANPAALVLFNGMMYPEAAVGWAARQRGLRVITHEVSFQRYSAFFTEGEATAYPLQIPKDFELNAVQNTRLDDYLEKRFQGKFTMAGIRFWPEMRGLDEAFLQKAAGFCQVVPVFTNVIFDTSQVHANTVFSHMFAWLDLVLDLIRCHPETLFVIRAHPDEMRPGTSKQSRESVREWVQRNRVDALPNVVFIDSQEYISSYELIGRAKFVIVYNSSIGMEATLLGAPVLCGGKARYTQVPTVFFPQTPEAYREQAEVFLAAEQIDVPPEFVRNARRFLYYQLFRTSLPFDAYLEAASKPGFVRLRQFAWRALLPENSATMQVIRDGVLHGKPFLLDGE
ncbi:MAG TPA: hypothetical protein VF498_15665 [Anaerolineales bacterium]